MTKAPGSAIASRTPAQRDHRAENSVAIRSGDECMQKLAILGGTFDPLHWGHLVMAETALTQVGVERVIWVPSHYPPHKSHQSLVSYEQRVEMIQLAIADRREFVLSTVEATRTHPSYAIATLQDLQFIYPNAQWYWIIGLDSLCTFPKWYQRATLAAECEWLVAPRPIGWANLEQPAITDPHAETWIKSHTAICVQKVAEKLTHEGIQLRWQHLHSPLMAISSSEIRQMCRDRSSIRYLVPEAVRLYIAKHHLYQAP